MSTGIVKFFNDSKGFGFITPDDGTEDLFVHFTSTEATGHRTLTQGQRVHYRGEMADKGPVAKDSQAAAVTDAYLNNGTSLL